MMQSAQETMGNVAGAVADNVRAASKRSVSGPMFSSLLTIAVAGYVTGANEEAMTS